MFPAPKRLWWWRHRVPQEFDVSLLRPPDYGRKRRNRGFETPEEAKRENKIRISILRQGKSRGSQKLAEKLEACSYRHPCGSPACRCCMREFRKTITGLAMMALSDQPQIRMVTLVFGKPYRDRWLAGSGPAPLPKAMVQKLRMDLQRHASAVAIAIGGVEVDLDARTNMAEPHIHLLVATDDRKELEALAKAYGKPHEVNRPIEVSRPISASDRPKVFSYPWKFAPVKKLKFVTTDASGKRKQRTRKVRLRGSAGRRALRWLNCYRPEDFLFVRGFVLRGCRFVPV